MILWRVLREHPEALVYVFFPTYRAAATALYCACHARPVVVYSGGVWSETISLSPRWRGRHPWYLGGYIAACRVLERLVFRKATVRFFTEATQLAAYERFGPTYRTRPLTRVKILSAPPQRELGQPARLLCVGDLWPVKGHDVLYEAVALLRQKKISVTLILAGNADSVWKAQLDARAARLGITPLIEWRGWIADAPMLEALYREADLFVLPTRSEGFPRVLYEAMGHGLPVVATNIHNIAAVVRHEERALLVPPDDPPALAGAVARLLADEALRARLATSGWGWAREQFSETAAQQFLRIIGEIS
jgi:glycosyltransferase involved in cell wall biosynthesis